MSPKIPIRQHMSHRAGRRAPVAGHLRAIPSRAFFGVIKYGKRKGTKVRVNPREEKTFQLQSPKTGKIIAGRVGSQSLRQRIRI